MATYTTELNLKKPEQSDFYNIQDQNDNMDKIDTHAANKQNPHEVNLEQVLSAGDSLVPITAGGTNAGTAENARTNLGVPPISHAVNAATYGKGNASVFGHCKISDDIGGTNKASTGIAASEYALGYLSKIVFGGLGSLTWADIATIAASGKAPNYFKVGDTKNVTLLNGEVITLVLANFNHDDLTTGGKAPITFIVKDCLKFTGTRYMNSTNTNVGSWKSSYMRSTVMTEVLAQLPSDLKSVIKTVYKKTISGNNSTSIQTTSDQLWLPSCIEVGTVTSDNEGTQYPLFTDNNSRIKLYSRSASVWWLRSPVAGAVYFHNVNTDGGDLINVASYASGVVFGLCV